MNTPSASHPGNTLTTRIVYNTFDHILLKKIDLIKGVVYDFGCGEAPYKNFILQYADTYRGVDWAACKHNSDADIVCDLNQPTPIETDAADTIISFSVLEHLSAPSCMLSEAFRVLKNHGTLLLHVPWQLGLHEEPHDYYRYTPYALELLLKKAGFKDIQIEHNGNWFSMLSLKIANFRPLAKSVSPSVRRILGLPFFLTGILLQRFAPLLDRLDPAPRTNALGYFVTAKKNP